MFWWKRKRIEGLLAASLYEPLSADDQQELDRALASDAALRTEYEAMRTMVRAIPVSAIEKTPDLIPVLNERLDSRSRAARGSGRRLIYAGAAAVFIAGLSFVAWYSQPSPSATSLGTRLKTEPKTQIAQALVQAKTLSEKKDYAGAYDLLRKVLKTQENDPQAGEAQLCVAELAFDLSRYPEAYDAYKTFFERYSDAMNSEKARKDRALQARMILDEAKQVDFVSLQAYDAAVRDRSDSFAALQQVASNYVKYRGTNQYAVGEYVAQKMAENVATVAGYDFNSPDGRLASYKAAHDRCSSPVAVALFDLKMGDTCETLKDLDSAKTHYSHAAAVPELASLATKALERIGSKK